MASPVSILLENLETLGSLFGDVAMGPGLAPVWLAIGALLVFVSLGILGWLSVGALLTPMLRRV